MTNSCQLALTFYVAHLLVGMVGLNVIAPDDVGKFSLRFSLSYALLFSAAYVAFAMAWRKHFSLGPLEWLFKKVPELPLPGQ